MIQRDYLCKLLHDIDKISFVRILKLAFKVLSANWNKSESSANWDNSELQQKFFV